MMKIASIALALATASTLVAQDDSVSVWADDFDVASAQAKKEGKDLLVDFTGSDWCGWCIKLDKEVFEHDEFLTEIQKSFVLVALDFPRGDEAKAKVPNPERNDELKTKFGVRGFPTILLMSAEGEVFAKTGYQPGGPTKYLASVKEMSSKGKASLKLSKTLVADYEAAKGDAKASILAKATATLKGMSAGDIGIAAFAMVVKQGLTSADTEVQIASIKALLASGQGDSSLVGVAMKLDPQNKKGLIAELLKAGQSSAELVSFVMGLDPKNEKGLQDYLVMGKMKSVKDKDSAVAFMDALDELILLGAKDTKVFEDMLARATSWAFRPMNDKERAVGYGELLEEHAADAAKYAKLLEAIRK